jgi:hypothetical protein
MTCVTIQCYMYDEDNHKHYDFFDYLDGQKHQTVCPKRKTYKVRRT